ncbi:SGNH/GDSL hydrolase family protein [Paenibacillus lutrae]|nr:SGNH/GDSL hydrolase family protein [Paenibacillus lutrae]
MHKIHANELCFDGAVSLESQVDGSKPWRIPHAQRTLFMPDAINGKAGVPAGVRIRFASDTRSAAVEVEPMDAERLMDCVIDGELFATAVLAPGESVYRFEGLPEGEKSIELFLSQRHPVTVRHLELGTDATYSVPDDKRPRWIAYGSSITQCEAAASPSQTWPAIVAQRKGWHGTNLGYSANCHMEPMVARMIRDMPADFISLCVGVNIMGGGSLNERTFQPALIGFVQIVREKHADIPIVVQSPIYASERESAPNKVGLTLEGMRLLIREAVGTLRENGDSRLYYVDGLDVFGQEYNHHLPDKLHPDAEGYKLMAESMIRQFGQVLPDGI